MGWFPTIIYLVFLNIYLYTSLLNLKLNECLNEFVGSSKLVGVKALDFIHVDKWYGLPHGDEPDHWWWQRLTTRLFTDTFRIHVYDWLAGIIGGYTSRRKHQITYRMWVKKPEWCTDQFQVWSRMWKYIEKDGIGHLNISEIYQPYILPNTMITQCRLCRNAGGIHRQLKWFTQYWIQTGSK